MNDLTLRYFKPDEFRGWWDQMDPALLVLLDRLRARLAPLTPDAGGVPISISPHPRAIGRHDGPDGDSQHNIDRWGEVRAIDVMPHIGRQYRRNVVGIAIDVGFTGVGVYPDWEPRWGLHLDTRQDRKPGDPATWSGIRIWSHEQERMVQAYRALEAGLA